MSIKIACKPLKAMMWTDETIALLGSVDIIFYDSTSQTLITKPVVIRDVEDFIYAMQNKGKVVIAELIQQSYDKEPAIYFMPEELPTEEEIKHFD